MDFTTALDRVGTDLTYCHGWSAFPNVRTADGWDADQICKFIWDTTDLDTPATLYRDYRPELREAYETIHRHVYLSHALTVASDVWNIDPLTGEFEYRLAFYRTGYGVGHTDEEQRPWFTLLANARLWELADILRMWSDTKLAAQPSYEPNAALYNGGFGE